MAGERIIEIDPSAGFCFGVEKAIEKAESALKEGGQVFGLGEMVHNEEETGRLEELGLKTISSDNFQDVKEGKVIFRAHGEPPSTYNLARKFNIGVIDATCPIVLRLQKKIGSRYKSLNPQKEQIVIFGKTGHPETIGLMGQTNNEAVLITDPDELTAVDPLKKIYLYSQTTLDPDDFHRLEENIERHIGKVDAAKMESDCTICGQMKRRKPALKELAEKHPLIIFVSGKSSSNGAMLYNYCKQLNKNTFLIHSVKDIQPEWLSIGGSIGISGATSTPVWQLEQVKQHLENLICGCP